MPEQEEGATKKEADETPLSKEIDVPIFAAAKAGDAAALASALSAAVDPSLAASHQDPQTGRSPLHLAAEADSVECIALLLEAGAPWNAVDRRGRCPGDAAVEKGCEDAAEALLEAGVRAELVLGAIADSISNKEIASSSSDGPGNEQQEGAEDGKHYLSQRATFHAAPSTGDATLSDERGRAVMMEWEGPIMKATAHAVAKGASIRNLEGGGGEGDGEEGGTGQQKKKNNNKRRVGGVVLNIGHGLGLVDAAIRGYSPRRHVICEPHPDVLSRMAETGWITTTTTTTTTKRETKREGEEEEEEGEGKGRIVVIPKRWQDALRDGDLRKHGNEDDEDNDKGGNGGRYDGIFYDPFDDGEIDVFLKSLPELLSKKGNGGGVASFFNGLCSDNAFFHRVACEVVQRKLSAAGLDCVYVPLPLPASATSEETWDGVTNRYWQLKTYNLPVITWKEEEDEEGKEEKEEE